MIPGEWSGRYIGELSTLHPYDPVFVTRFVAAVKGDLAAGELLPNAPAWAGARSIVSGWGTRAPGPG